MRLKLLQAHDGQECSMFLKKPIDAMPQDAVVAAVRSRA